MEEFIPDPAVMNLCRGRIEAVCHPAVHIHADVRLHAEIPVVALLCGRHLGVAGSGLVLSRGRRVDDRRVNQRARAQRNALVGQMRVHIRKERLGQPMPLQQVAEVEDSGLIGDAIIARASNATRTLNAASWFLRFDISVLLVLGDQQTSDRSFRHCPISGG